MTPFLSYLITDPSCYGTDPDTFTNHLTIALRTHRPQLALYRDKANPVYDTFATHFVRQCREFGTRAILHGNPATALQLHADGVHLTSTQIDDTAAATAAGLYTVVSTHTHQEILRARDLGADAVTYSPIFASPGKGVPKGVQDLSRAVQVAPTLSIIALGGILTPEQIKAVRNTGAAGFASIRYFCPPFNP